MKREYKCILSLIIAVLLLVSSTGTAFAISNNANQATDELLALVSNEEVLAMNGSYEVYGNTDLSDKEFRDIVNQGENKIYLHYRTNKDIDLPYDALLKIKTSTTTYSYEYIEMEDTQPEHIRSGIKEFLLNYSTIINTGLTKQEDEPAIALTSDTPTTFINCVVQKEFVMRFSDKGYIIYNIAVSRYTVDSESIIFIVTVNNSFVPGIVAYNNNESGYDQYKNQEGFVHMTVEQAYDANEEYYYGRRWGNVPYKKDYWPVNNPGVVAITSSIQNGQEIGYSFENGFSVENVSISTNVNRGANISFGYSKTIERTEPALSVQVSSSNLAECQWYYTYSEDASETYHQQTNYMFEISNSRNGMQIGDFRLKLDYKFVVDKGSLYAASTNEGSVDLIVRAGTYNDIYDFCGGMI